MCWNISSGWIKSGSETGFLSDGEKRRACMLQSIQARFQVGSALQDRVIQLIFRKAGQLGDLLDGVLGREPFVHPRADERERAFKRAALLRRPPPRRPRRARTRPGADSPRNRPRPRPASCAGPPRGASSAPGTGKFAAPRRTPRQDPAAWRSSLCGAS